MMTMNRRRFLHASLIGGAALALPFGSGWIAHGAPLGAQPDMAQKRLVVIFLRGAVDGLSVVVPYGDDGYYAARRSIALQRPGQAGGVIDLDGHFGLNPALAAMMPFWRERSLAFVQACGSPDPTRSHFDAQIFMETGTPGRSATPDGWMNRLLGQMPGPRAPTEAIAIGPTVPRIMTGAFTVANMTLGAGAGKPMAIDRPEISQAFARLYGGTDKMSQAFQEGQEARRQVTLDIDPDAEQQAANNGAPLPNGFPGDATRLGKMMLRDPSIRLAFLALGGWDTHVNQGNAQGQLAGRLGSLGAGLANLAAGLGPAYKDTIIVVMSEFGRTVHENGNGGTDHGHGNVMWLMGGGVAGGRVYGEWPTLAPAALYQNRDLAVTSDFRAVLAPILARHLGVNDKALSAVLPGGFKPAPRLGSSIRA
jgi:uncharacterized protein (DUF1501 family)